jgi:hypothetical protein
MTKPKERKNIYSFHLGLPFLSYPGSISNINSVQGNEGEINIGCYEKPSGNTGDNYAPKKTIRKKPTNTDPEQNKTEPKKKTPTPRKKADSRKPPYKVDSQQKQPSYACLFYNSNIVQGKDSSMGIC